jgi:hypothetical protein
MAGTERTGRIERAPIVIPPSVILIVPDIPLSTAAATPGATAAPGMATVLATTLPTP